MIARRASTLLLIVAVAVAVLIGAPRPARAAEYTLESTASYEVRPADGPGMHLDPARPAADLAPRLTARGNRP